jgi:transposase-like protein
MSRKHRRDREYWQSLVQRYEESGESRADFVRNHGVKLGTFQSWLYKIRHERAQLTTRRPCVTPQGFVEVVAQRYPEQGMRMRVGTAMLEFNRLPDTRWLSELIYDQRGRAIC